MPIGACMWIGTPVWSLRLAISFAWKHLTIILDGHEYACYILKLINHSRTLSIWYIKSHFKSLVLTFPRDTQLPPPPHILVR